MLHPRKRPEDRSPGPNLNLAVKSGKQARQQNNRQCNRAHKPDQRAPSLVQNPVQTILIIDQLGISDPANKDTSQDRTNRHEQFRGYTIKRIEEIGLSE